MLERQFDAWVLVQAVYMPAVGPYRRAQESPAPIAGTSATIHDVRLMLPSEVAGLVDFDPALGLYEFKFRIAQAYSTLGSLRGSLLTRQQLTNSKKKYAYGTAAATRSNSLIQKLSDKILLTAAAYRNVHRTLGVLETMAGESAALARVFKPLNSADVTGLKSMEDGSEGFKTLSWIWHIPGVGEKEGEAAEAGESRAVMFGNVTNTVALISQPYASSFVEREHGLIDGRKNACFLPKKCDVSCGSGSGMLGGGKRGQTAIYPSLPRRSRLLRRTRGIP